MTGSFRSETHDCVCLPSLVKVLTGISAFGKGKALAGEVETGTAKALENRAQRKVVEKDTVVSFMMSMLVKNGQADEGFI